MTTQGVTIKWYPTSYFNVEDWDTLLTAYDSIWSWLFEHGWPRASTKLSYSDRGELTLPTIQRINTLEHHIQETYDRLPIRYPEWENTKEWLPRKSEYYKSNPTYLDWIRWSNYCLRLVESLNSTTDYSNNRICGTFKAGSTRTVQYFSRGR